MISNVYARVRHFESHSCREAVFTSNWTSWSAMCSSNEYDDPLCLGEQHEFAVGRAGSLRLVYIRNEKAASTTLMNGFRSAFDVQTSRHYVGHNVRAMPRGNHTRLVTFVRDPFSMALAGYLELRQRAMMTDRGIVDELVPKIGSTLDHQGRSLLSGFQEMTGRLRHLLGIKSVEDWQSCNNGSEATQQFVRFLRAVQLRVPLGIGAQHIFPQVHKVGHTIEALSNVSRFHAIGAIENLKDDLDQMRTSIGVRPIDDKGSRVFQIIGQKRNSHKTVGCARVDVENENVWLLIRSIYKADFICFGYRHDTSTQLSVPFSSHSTD